RFSYWQHKNIDDSTSLDVYPIYQKQPLRIDLDLFRHTTLPLSLISLIKTCKRSIKWHDKNWAGETERVVGGNGRVSKGKRVVGENGGKGDGRGTAGGRQRGWQRGRQRGRTLSILLNNRLSKDQLISLLLNMSPQNRILEKVPRIKEWSRNTFFQHIRIDLDYSVYPRRIPSISHAFLGGTLYLFSYI